MVNPLLITKLYPPAPRSDRVSVEQLSRVQRKRLLEKLDQGLTRKLILISAAAGFGKTTVLSEWAHQICPRHEFYFWSSELQRICDIHTGRYASA